MHYQLKEGLQPGETLEDVLRNRLQFILSRNAAPAPWRIAANLADLFEVVTAPEPKAPRSGK